MAIPFRTDADATVAQSGERHAPAAATTQPVHPNAARPIHPAIAVEETRRPPVVGGRGSEGVGAPDGSKHSVFPELVLVEPLSSKSIFLQPEANNDMVKIKANIVFILISFLI